MHPRRGWLAQPLFETGDAHTMPGYHRGRPPRNKREQYPAAPADVEEIVAVMRTLSERADGHWLRALIVLLWRRAPHQ
jgi:hypothetical protein